MVAKKYEIVARLDEISHDTWLKERAKGIGGSDAGAIMGYSKYDTPLTKWMQKTGRMKKEVSGEAVEVGNILEAPIRREILPDYLDNQGYAIYNIIDPEYIYRSVEYPWMVANVDGFIEMPGDTVGLEIKTGSSYTLKGWGGKDGEEVPDDYYCQVQHYMAVLGLDRFVIFGLIGNCRVYRIVERNDEFIGELIETERSFWQLVEENNPVSAPLPTGKECDLEALLELGNPQNDSVVDLSGYDDMLQKYMGVCEDIKILQTEKKRMYQELIAAMGHAKYGESTEYRLSLSRYNVNRLDTKRLKVEHPEIYENYTKEAEQARLYIKSGGK